jgi:autotransporter-associated beta strand protein
LLGSITDSYSNILGVTKTGSGTWTLAGANDTYAAGTTVSAGTLVFDSPGAFPLFSKLIVDGTAVAAYQGTPATNTLFASSLTLSGTTNDWTGTLDLTDNDLVVRNGSLGTLANQVTQGYNPAGGGNWQGSGGILSSTAAADTTHLTALGVIQNSIGGNTSAPALYTSFDGQPVFNTDVLVKYTYYGDSDLSGSVDGGDYSRIDNGYLNNLTGWFNGDFNYDGVIDGSDYTLIDNSYNTQGAHLSSELAAAASTAQLAGATSVPEPASLTMVGMTAVALLRRRVHLARRAT